MDPQVLTTQGTHRFESPFGPDLAFGMLLVSLDTEISSDGMRRLGRELVATPCVYVHVWGHETARWELRIDECSIEREQKIGRQHNLFTSTDRFLDNAVFFAIHILCGFGTEVGRRVLIWFVLPEDPTFEDRVIVERVMTMGP